MQSLIGDILSLGLPLLMLFSGLALVVLEALAPGAHFIVIGVALLLAGLVGALVGGPLASPLGLAAMLLVFGGGAFLAYRELDVYGGSDRDRTSDSDSLRGSTGRVTERVTATEGEVKLDDGGFNPHYTARAVDGEIPEGEEVIVVDPGGGNVLTVESMSGVEMDSIDRELERDRESKSRSASTSAGSSSTAKSSSASGAAEADDVERERELE